MLNVVILASAPHDDKGYPLCLQEYENETILQYVVKHNLADVNADFTFVFQQDDVKRYHLDNIAQVIAPNSRVVAIKGSTSGSACTALYAACALDQYAPLLIISTNEIVTYHYADILDYFNASQADGGVMTFESVHPRYSYAKLIHSEITELAQQNPISNHATTGSFWFRKTSDFVHAAQKSISDNCVTSRQFYIAPTYNQMILSGMKVCHYDVNGHYLPFK